MKKTLGGDRLGSGKRMQVELHGYERSTHDMGYIWRSTMAAGTLVPFMSEVGLPGDTFDIDLDMDIKTHPTIGPLFGSYKAQLDVFMCPIRLYQGLLHNNKLGIGLTMSQIHLPQIKLYALPVATTEVLDWDNLQINPSSLLSYLNIRGVGYQAEAPGTTVERLFNGVPFLSYWDIYKNYYANKQEGRGVVISTPPVSMNMPGDIQITVGSDVLPANVTAEEIVMHIETLSTLPEPANIIVQTNQGELNLGNYTIETNRDATSIELQWRINMTGPISIYSWRYIAGGEIPGTEIQLGLFNLNVIDTMREDILKNTELGDALIINDQSAVAAADWSNPYTASLNWNDSASPYIYSQQGLGVKTYQSDLFNNWLDTADIDTINDITSISTAGDVFTIDALNLSKKVYDMLNRIAVSGGTYDDWLDAVYTHDRYQKAETPMYMGGLIKELVFQEVVSNTATETEDGVQPLGTLAGKGVLAGKHKGGKIRVSVDEPCYIIGIASLTPRLDYSQGNKWDTNLQTMDDLHKPALDQIGFQELIQEQMAWWTTHYDGTQWQTQSAGKQPAWINYMTNVNQVRGNFAIATNEMWMTLNRKYQNSSFTIEDLTTYIDPTKYNQIFAQTSLDSQNFWTQISVDITARRKMSAKLMPNL